MGAGVGALLFTVYLFIVFWFMDHVLPIQKNKIKKTYSIYFLKSRKTDTKLLSISLHGLAVNKFIHRKNIYWAPMFQVLFLHLGYINKTNIPDLMELTIFRNIFVF